MASPRKKRPLKHSSSMSQAKEAELQKAFSLADADGSGRITEEEFYQMYRNQGGHALAQQLVGHFPGNDSQTERRERKTTAVDVKISLTPSQGVNMTREEASTLFRENDKDQDGFISMEEYFGQGAK